MLGLRARRRDITADRFGCAYNEWDQLTAFGGAEGYGYLAPPAAPTYDVGSLQTKGSATYAYPAPGTARPYAPTGVSTVGALGYDANGSRASDPTYAYAYDVEGWLVSLMQESTTVLTNTYDGDGLRLVRVAGGTATHFVGDWYEVDPATGIATAYYPFDGQAIAMKAGGTLAYMHRDHLGSLVSASNTGGGELGWARYWPYGGLRLSGGTLPTDRMFTGQTRDLGNDARYFFKSRYYDAAIGQFQVPDLAVPMANSQRGSFLAHPPARRAPPSARARLRRDGAGTRNIRMERHRVDEFAPYHAAVRWIHSNIRGPADGPPAEPGYPIDERIRRKFARLHSILAQLDHPERRFAPLHVAGTSGKGSTSALIASMTAAAGLRTALHVTPYLQTPLEKLLVNGRPMNVDRFAQLVNAFRPKVERFNAASTVGPLRYGELWVTLTLAAYAAERVDVGVVEVGRGGRYDATNVITPVVSVINRVGYDHVRSLGPTLRDIAGHKAGIIKAGVPAVVAEQEAEALDVIVGEARRQEAPVYLAGHDFFWRLRERAPSGSAFSYEDAAGRIDDLFVPLLGDFQVANAALAIAALRVARLGRAVDPVAIRSGVAGVRFPGRLERVQESPEVYLDGAHNGQKAEALAAALGQLAAGRRLVLVLGILASHNAHDIVAALAPHADAIVCTPTNVIGKGATPPDDLAALCRPYCRHVEVEPGAARATARGIDLAGQAGVVCVTGSLYLVGEARARWHSEIDILRSAWRQDEDPLPDLVAAIS